MLPGVRRAYVDESFREAELDGFYVLVAAMFEPARYDLVRQAMRELRGRRCTRKLHWNEMDDEQRRTATKKVVDLGGFHLVAVGAPVPSRRQGRARAKCLTELVIRLHEHGVEQLCVESRTPVLDARDVTTVRGARYVLPKGSAFRVDHMVGAQEELLWAADIVAGIVRAGRQGQAEYRQFMGRCLHEIDVATDC